MELYTTERSIYEVGLSQVPYIFRGQENRRIESLWACANATKSWIGVFLSITPAQYVGFSALTYSNMTHCFLSVYRLSTFEHPDWDRAFCIEHIDVSSFLKEGERNFAQVKEAAGLDVDSEDVDSFSMMASRIQAIQKLWHATNASRATSTTEPFTGGRHEIYDFPMEFSDGDWLKDLLGTWNE
jgi:hypothetical protein